MEPIPEEPEEKPVVPEPETKKPELTEEDKQIEYEILQECVQATQSLQTRYWYLLASLRTLNAKLAAIWWRRQVSLLSLVPTVKGHQLSLVSVKRDLQVLERYLNELDDFLYMLLHILYYLNEFAERRQMIVLVVFRFLRFVDTYCREYLGKLNGRFSDIVEAIKKRHIWVKTDEFLQYDMIPTTPQ